MEKNKTIMAHKKDLLRWYKTNIFLISCITKKDRIKLNNFWLRWEKNKLFIKRIFKK